MGQKIHTKDSGVGVVTPAFIVPQVDPATGKVYRMSNDEYQVAMEGYSVLSGTSWDGTNKKVTLSGNLSIALSSSRIHGVLIVTQDNAGSHTLNINSVSIPIGTDANASSIVAYFKLGSQFLISVNTAPVLVGSGSQPAAPTAPVTDDSGDTFNWTNNPAFTALSDYEYTLNGGSSYTPVTAKPVVVGNVNKAIGQVGVRVKSTGGNPASNTLFNAVAFSATGTTPAAPTVPVTDDSADTFNWTNNPLFTAPSDYEFTLDGGTTFSPVTVKPVVVGNLAKTAGQVGVRVKAVGINPPSATLFNTVAFTVSTNWTIGSAPWYSIADPHELVAGGPSYGIISGTFVLYDLLTHEITTARDYMQGTPAKYPTIIDSGINGRKSLEVDDGKYARQTEAYSGDLVLVRVVAVKDALPHGYAYITGGTSSHLDLAVGTTTFGSGSKPLLYSGGGGNVIGGLTDLVTDQAHVFILVRKSATLDFELWMDGTLVASGNNPSADTSWEGGSLGVPATGIRAWIGMAGEIRQLPAAGDIVSLTNSLRARFNTP
jgi:hypothetical protein